MLEAQQSTVEVFGRWQTEEYIAHPIVDVSCQLTNLRVSFRQPMHVKTVFNPQGSKVNVGTSDLSIYLVLVPTNARIMFCQHTIIPKVQVLFLSNLLDHLGAWSHFQFVLFQTLSSLYDIDWKGMPFISVTCTLIMCRGRSLEMSMAIWSYSSPQCYHLEGPILEVSAESVKYLNYLISKSSSIGNTLPCLTNNYNIVIIPGIILVWMICCVCAKYYMLYILVLLSYCTNIILD